VDSLRPFLPRRIQFGISSVVAFQRERRRFYTTSPWQNGFTERLIGSIRRERMGHVIVLGEAHLRRILKSYATTASERIGLCTRMRLSLARFSDPAS
jgi:hypothetical protein